MKKIIIVGASSGIGFRLAQEYAEKGCRLGIAARREAPLNELANKYPGQISVYKIDVTDSLATINLRNLIAEVGGMDIFVLVSGVGKQNPNLDSAIEETTTLTNVMGFTRMVDEAFRYFRDGNRQGHIAVVSSIAGTKGLGIAASYSATKRYQNIYIDALEQLAKMQHVDVKFTDIKPGFISTPLLDGEKSYPMMMTLDYAMPRIVAAIEKKSRRAIIDWRWAIAVSLWRLIPAWLWKRLPIKNRDK